jgi:hypothetical protein
VQDYQVGRVGFQQHPWQATLGMEAVVWTTLPCPFRARLGPQRLAGTDAWTGHAALPRVVQHRNVAAILSPAPGPLQRLLFEEAAAHAHVPRGAFDEVREAPPWVFARAGEGFLALASARPATWVGERELRAASGANVWLCQLGSAREGRFDAFCARIAAAELAFSGLEEGAQGGLGVRYAAPGAGLLEASLAGAATLDGASLRGGEAPRFENRYAHVPWGAEGLVIRHGGLRLVHDERLGERAGDGLGCGGEEGSR